MSAECCSIQSACECQAQLFANLDKTRMVLKGWATRCDTRENAPAHSMGADGERFDVAWHCPYCGRHTMRTFYAGALERVRCASAAP